MPETKIPVSFKFGVQANLPAAVTNGQLLITTDEKALYFDVAGNRIRLGDFQTVANLAALPASAPETALFLVEDINVLAHWDGSKWAQINRDTGATAVDVTGDGNAVTGASYDAATRKITLTKGVTFAVPQDIADAIDALDLANTYYGKSAGEALAGRVGDIEADYLTSTDKTELAGDISDLSDRVGEIPLGATATTVVGYAKEMADSKDAAIAAAKKAGDDADAKADTKVASVTAGNDGVVIGGTATAPTVGVKLSAKADNQLSISEVAGEEGLYYHAPAAAEYTVEKLATAETGYAASYVLKKDNVQVGATINIPKDMVVESGSVVTNPEGQPAGTYIKLVLANADEDELFINVGDLIEYVTSGSQAGDMVVIAIDAQHRVTASITAGTITATELDTELNTKINKAHDHANKAELDLFETGDKSKLDTAATKAAANESAITAIKDGTNIDSFGDVETALDGKQDTIPANTYDAYGAAADVLGTSTDAATANTVYGAKAAAAAAQGDVDALETLVGTLPAGATAATVVEYIDEKVSDGLSWGTF